jgi:hypothetical protein
MGITGFSTASMLSSIAAPFIAPSVALVRRLGLGVPASSLQAGANRTNRTQRTATSRVAVPSQARLSVRRPYSFLSDQQASRTGPTTPAPINRLKIVRVVDASARRDCAGRMVISGRMADVCAELDRMAQCEAI